jgi:hypothetical protein
LTNGEFISNLRRVRLYCLQLSAFSVFAAVLGYFSAAPVYRLLGDKQAVIKLSFSHSAQLKYPCTARPEHELAKLAPNMRNPMDCPRERAPVVINLWMDGLLLLSATSPPQGFHKDGAATVYRRLAIPAGSHQFTASLADGPDGNANFTIEHQSRLDQGQVLIIDFQSGKGGFVFTGG